MVYKAIVDFKDLRTGHDYKAGDIYPFEGEADKDRVKMLITPMAQRGSLIEPVDEVTSEPEPETVPEAKKRGRPSKAEKTMMASKEKK